MKPINKEILFFEEDIVELIRKKKRKQKNKIPFIGIIEEVGGQTNSDYEEESEDSELSENEVIVKWMDGTTTTHKKHRVLLVDRSVCHGNIVKKCENFPSGKCGTVSGIKLLVDVEVVHQNRVIRGLNSKYLVPLHSYPRKKFCVYNGNTVCRIKRVYFNLVVRFPRDATSSVRLKRVNFEDFFSEREEDRLFDISFPFYPSQKLHFSGKVEFLREGEWIKGQYKKKLHKKGIIESVEVESLDLIKKLRYDNGGGSETKGDEEDRIIPKVDPKKVVSFSYYDYSNWSIMDYCMIPLAKIDEIDDHGLFNEEEEQKQENRSVDLVRIVNAKTYCEVMWQEGTVEKDIRSISLYPNMDVQETEFFPFDYVDLSSESSDSKRGVVVKMDHKTRMCVIKPVKNENIVELQQEISSFEVKSNEDFAYAHGDVVVRLGTNDSKWVGEIIGIEENLSLRVKWIDRTISTVKYFDVLGLNSVLDEDSDDDDTDDSDDESEGESGDESDGDESDGDSDDEVEKVAVLKYKISKDYIPEDKPEEQNDENESKPDTFSENTPFVGPNELKMEPKKVADQFYMAEEFSRHKFSNESMKEIDGNSELIKTVQKEWKVLRNSLPANIFVFISRSRIDLMRAVILGSEGTPYFNSFFIFDTFFPNEYNFVPPKVLFWSKGLEINPNLYDNGDICLSLLNTWNSPNEDENWVPGNSNIFQVFLSISSLVLTKNPYFNEAGFKKIEKTTGGKNNSRLFAENVFLKIIKHQISMLAEIHLFPVDLKIFLRKHVENVHERMLKDLREMSKGETKIKEYNMGETSLAFQKTLMKIIPKLETAYQRIIKNRK